MEIVVNNTDNKFFVYKVAAPVPMRQLFDYLPPIDMKIAEPAKFVGYRIAIPFGSRNLVGIIWDIAYTTDHDPAKLKPITAILDNFKLFNAKLMYFSQKVADYYHHPIGEVCQNGLPQAFKQLKSLDQKITDVSSSCAQLDDLEKLASKNLELNTNQLDCLNKIISQENKFCPFLLEGVTGSGKTEIYMQAAMHFIKSKQQVLILIPEISLTPQTIRRFQSRFGDQIAQYHSALTPKKRLTEWQKVQNAQAKIIIGTRSAIFLPINQLGLIIVDEEHDLSYKQQEKCRYMARDLAVLRAKQNNCPVVLGSATPSLETLQNAANGRYQWLKLPNRANNQELPTIKLIDIRHNKLTGGFSNQLLEIVKQHLTNDGQVLIFINRRGFAPTYMCFSCNWMATCKHCDARLTYHHKESLLICHHCQRITKTLTTCPDCQSNELNPVGVGTEKLESVLEEHFPSYNIARIDSDITRKQKSLHELLEAARTGKSRILVGTQMLAKGHHFPKLSLVAIIDADGGLFSSDFRAGENMSQLLIQVAGRAGRAHTAGEVAIQTCHPEHPLMQAIITQNYSTVTNLLLEERKSCHFPPFSHLALLSANSHNKKKPQEFLQELSYKLKQDAKNLVQISGPVPAHMSKKNGRYRFNLLMQAKSRANLHQILSKTTKLIDENLLTTKKDYTLRWALDVDPMDLV